LKNPAFHKTTPSTEAAHKTEQPSLLYGYLVHIQGRQQKNKLRPIYISLLDIMAALCFYWIQYYKNMPAARLTQVED
jgi:hypothetical protein